MTNPLSPPARSPWDEGIRFSEQTARAFLENLKGLAMIAAGLIGGVFAKSSGAEDLGLFCFLAAGLFSILLLLMLGQRLLAFVWREPVPNFVVTRAGVVQFNGFRKRRVGWKDISDFRVVVDPDSEMEVYGAVAFRPDQVVPEGRRAQWKEASVRLVLPGASRDNGRADALFCFWLNEWRAAMLNNEDFPDIAHLQPIWERAQLKFLP